MPQQSLIPDYPPMTSFAVVIKSYPHTMHPDEVIVAVKVGVGSVAEPKTRWMVTLPGVQRDYLNTLVESAAMTYMYGETPRDVVKACAAVHKLARQHERTCSM